MKISERIIDIKNKKYWDLLNYFSLLLDKMNESVELGLHHIADISNKKEFKIYIYNYDILENYFKLENFHEISNNAELIYPFGNEGDFTHYWLRIENKEEITDIDFSNMKKSYCVIIGRKDTYCNIYKIDNKIKEILEAI